MTARTTAALPAWAGITANVEVERVTAPAFYATAYRVYVDGAEVGYVFSQRERGHTTMWGHAASLSERLYAGAPSRPVVLEALVSSAVKR